MSVGVHGMKIAALAALIIIIILLILAEIGSHRRAQHDVINKALETEEGRRALAEELIRRIK